ncbi:5-formyltetrahydrofolate cyclo-ligase [Parapedobacter koreensis]|uniref:5-formyltetrahydrofolate cyclo-ligase n=1 Tax=Parapedobacter koreensis TaxID=332977 RepID=A0A1H7QU92_9SPHI|nr:5-formyltetrahydrofolate cyclo-ligase [Parapedobacter koreensis]SEL50867.1 5-formyltetrahydrofolate cyclo-ligase [Parapedobacter koreensis]
MHPTTKQELRKIYREKRMLLADDEFHRLNQQLLSRVKQVDFTAFLTVHLFLPIKGNHEPDTYAIATWLRQQYPTIRLALSRSDRTTLSMQHFLWDEKTELNTNDWGIPEPENGIAIPPDEINAVFVPLLAFDRQGHRVGYGKGFYDRFLRVCRPDTAKIGLSLFEPVPEIKDTNAWDIRLDQCITPLSSWNFAG